MGVFWLAKIGKKASMHIPSEDEEIGACSHGELALRTHVALIVRF